MNRLSLDWLLRASSLAAAALLLIGACTVDEPCDPGQVLVGNLCVDPPSGDGDGDGGAGGQSAGGATSGDSDGDGDSVTEPPNFGESCTEQGDCTGGTVCAAPQLPICVGQCGPGEPFEDACPAPLACVEPIADTFICME